jgi:hypothetical protein
VLNLPSASNSCSKLREEMIGSPEKPRGKERYRMVPVPTSPMGCGRHQTDQNHVCTSFTQFHKFLLHVNLDAPTLPVYGHAVQFSHLFYMYQCSSFCATPFRMMLLAYSSPVTILVYFWNEACHYIIPESENLNISISVTCIT